MKRRPIPKRKRYTKRLRAVTSGNYGGKNCICSYCTFMRRKINFNKRISSILKKELHLELSEIYEPIS